MIKLKNENKFLQDIDIFRDIALWGEIEEGIKYKYNNNLIDIFDEYQIDIDKDNIEIVKVEINYIIN